MDSLVSGLYVQHRLNCRFAASLVSHLLAFSAAQGKCRIKAAFPQWYSELAFHSFETRLSVSVSFAGSHAMIKCTTSLLSVWNGSCGFSFRGRSTCLGLFPMVARSCTLNFPLEGLEGALRLSGGTYSVSLTRKVSDSGTF